MPKSSGSPRVEARLKRLFAVVTGLTILTCGAAQAARPLALSLSVVVAAPGDRIGARLSGARAGEQLVLSLTSRAGGDSRRIGRIVADKAGRGLLTFRLPQLGADLYTLVGRRKIGGVVRAPRPLAVVATPPSGFGPVGAAACNPASPRNGADAFATAAGAQLWALLGFSPPGASLVGDTATYEGIVGKEVKIVFRMTSGVPRTFYAVAPDGAKTSPLWGPTPHTASNWTRPGSEWGAGFVFSVPGCWRVHAGKLPVQGDLWISVLS